MRRLIILPATRTSFFLKLFKIILYIHCKMGITELCFLKRIATVVFAALPAFHGAHAVFR